MVTEGVTETDPVRVSFVEKFVPWVKYERVQDQVKVDDCPALIDVALAVSDAVGGSSPPPPPSCITATAVTGTAMSTNVISNLFIIPPCMQL